MKNIILYALLMINMFFSACDDGKGEMIITKTSNNIDGKVVKKEIVNINETIEGKKVEIKAENGEVSSLTIDGKEIAKEDFKTYKSTIDLALKEFPSTSNLSQISISDDTTNISDMDRVLEIELKKDGFIHSDKVKYDFDLSQNALIINGVTQPDNVKNRYLQLFKNATGKEIGEKFHIKLSEDRK
jgi:hypothetical protein